MNGKHANGSVRKARQAAAAPAVKEVMYRECGRNYALASGGHVVDGCGEWMPPLGGFNPAEASSYKCAACGCHRNFHRRVVTERSLPPPPPMAVTLLHGPPQRREATPEDRLPGVDSDTDSAGTEYDSDATEYDHERFVSPPLQPRPMYQWPPAYLSSTPHRLQPLNSSAPGAPQSQRLPAQLSPATAPPPHRAMSAGKRCRTTFTAEQKQGMQDLAERLGWRLQKRNKDIVDAGCHEIGVSRYRFRNWMHNRKRKDPSGHSASAGAPSRLPLPPPLE